MKMKMEKKIIIKLSIAFIVSIIFYFLFCLIHEFGHVLGCFLCGVEVTEFHLDNIMTSGKFGDYLPHNIQLLIIYSSGSLFSVFVWTLLSYMIKNKYISLSKFSAYISETLCWTIGFFFTYSDMVCFSNVLEISPYIISIIILPFLFLSMYYLTKYIKSYRNSIKELYITNEEIICPEIENL